MTSSHRLFWPVLLTGTLWLAHRFVAGSAPLLGSGDVNAWEHLGFYFSRHVSLWPVPRLELWSDALLFPHGIVSGYQAWAFERETLWWLANRWLGPGPWLGVYAAASFAVAGIGVRAWLKEDFGPARAAWVGLGAAFLNFYAVHKYPAHLNVVVCHWTVIGVAADFVLYRRFVDGGRLTLRALAMRALLLVLSLGQDLSFVAGLALSSFSITFAFMAAGLARRHLAGAWNARQALARWRDELRERPAPIVAASLPAIALAWYYVPLVLQLFFLTREHPVPAGGVFYASALRWLVPWLPVLNPGNGFINGLFRDSAEGLGAASPGWA